MLSKDDTLPDRTKLSVAQVVDLLNLCLTTTYFVYAGCFYAQREGAAMGSPVSPVVANLFMEHFEQKALATFLHPIKFWGRYVDDALSILKTAQEDGLFTHLNNVDKRIQWTKEQSVNRSIAMLDERITAKEDGHLTFSVYRKSTHTDQYLQYDSHQPLQHKLGVVRTLSHRARSICSTPEALDAEMKHLEKVLSISGYPRPKDFLCNSTSKKKVPHPRTQSNTRSRGNLSIPYVQGVTEAISRRFRKHGIITHARAHDTIRRKLPTPKDKDPLSDQAGVVYHIKCQDCDSDYIGETDRKLHKRVADHTRANNTGAVQAHLAPTGHSLSDEQRVLARDHRWFQRGVRESIHIRTRKPTLNNDGGRHKLSQVFNPLLLPDHAEHNAVQQTRKVATTTRRSKTDSFSDQVLLR